MATSRSIDDRWTVVDKATGKRVPSPRHGQGRRWRARYRTHTGGRQITKAFERKVDAQRWLDEQTTAIVTGRYVDPYAGRVTFGTWFDQWRDEQVWEDSTAESAATVAATVPFSDVELRELTTSHVQRWVKSMSTTSTERKKALAASTIKLRFNYVHMALLAAVERKVIAEAPTVGVRLGERAKRVAVVKVEPDEIPTPEQVRKALEVAPAHFRPFIAVCAFAGLRLGEAAGLRVDAVDFLGRTLRVEQQLQGSTVGTTRIVEPKKGSRRTVPMPTALVELLSVHVRDVGTRNGYLFANGPDLWNRNSAAQQWRRVRAAVGMESFTLHSLRHFFASGLINAGCDVATVQHAMGHSTPAITLTIYTHVWPKSEDRARDAATVLMASVLSAEDSLRTEAQIPRKSGAITGSS